MNRDITFFDKRISLIRGGCYAKKCASYETPETIRNTGWATRVAKKCLVEKAVQTLPVVRNPASIDLNLWSLCLSDWRQPRSSTAVEPGRSIVAEPDTNMPAEPNDKRRTNIDRTTTKKRTTKRRTLDTADCHGQCWACTSHLWSPVFRKEKLPTTFDLVNIKQIINK